MKKGLIIITVFMVAFFCTELSYCLTMGPARLEVSLPAGELAEGDYYVQNDTDQDAHILVEPENWFEDVYNYKNINIKDWVEFDTYEFDLKPKEIKKLKLRIKVPKDVKGELVAQIFFTSTALGEDGKPVEGIKARVGSVLYLSIKGTEVVDAEIKNISISKVAEEGKQFIKVSANVKNKGNIHIRPSGKVAIYNEAGEKVTELDLNYGAPTLPGEEKEYDALWEESKTKKGLYKVSVTINYGKELNMDKTLILDNTFEIGVDGKVMVK